MAPLLSLETPRDNETRINAKRNYNENKSIGEGWEEGGGEQGTQAVSKLLREKWHKEEKLSIFTKKKKRKKEEKKKKKVVTNSTFWFFVLFVKRERY